MNCGGLHRQIELGVHRERGRGRGGERRGDARGRGRELEVGKVEGKEGGNVCL